MIRNACRTNIVCKEIYSSTYKQKWSVQLGRHETVNTKSKHYNPRLEGSMLVRGDFLLSLFCSSRSTILAEVAE